MVLVFGQDREPEVQVKLNGQNLKLVTSHPHLGVPLCSRTGSELEMVSERITTCERKFYMMEGLSGSNTRLTPLTLSKMYNSVCIPALCYGAESWCPSEASMLELEKLHLKIGRRIQGLPKTTSEPASHCNTWVADCDWYF